MFRKILQVLALFLFLLLYFKNVSYAQEEFLVDSTVNYTVDTSGITHVTHNITLENSMSNIYATSYSLVLDNIKVDNPKATQDGKGLNISSTEKDDITTINVSFEDSVVGRGNKRNFQISYNNSQFTQKTGEVWEISIPRLDENNTYRNYTVNLSVPSAFGNEAYISPAPDLTQNINDTITYYFNKSSVEKTGITAGFGLFQVFSFDINYHLENPLNKQSSTQIAVPPDTSLQRVYFQSMQPKPDNITLDADGNWIATYTLSPRQRFDVKLIGSVQIFSSPRPFLTPSQETLNNNLATSEYWDINNSEIQKLASELKTPKNIYDYVWQNLHYDYSRVVPNVTRLGAVEALHNPQNAICMEYTDLFIAISRAAGIPAREINGYAYTENPDIQPLSLVSDVLHSWPEYWDSHKQEWISIDPTWASTTKGVDFFNKLDLRHFAFVIHGVDPKTPYPPGSYKLGSNPQKDVFVSFGKLPKEQSDGLSINIENQSKFAPFVNKYKVTVTNNGQVAVYNQILKTKFDSDVLRTETITTLPPYGVYESNFNVPFSFLAKNTPSNVTVEISDKTLSVATNKNIVIIYNLIFIFSLLIVALTIIIIRLKRKVIKSKILSYVAKIKGFKKNSDI